MSSFTNISTFTNGGLISLNIKYSNSCVKGIDFIYNDDTIVKTGFNDFTYNVTFFLNQNERLYAVNSYCAYICDIIQFQTINTLTNKITTINTGKPVKYHDNYVNVQFLIGISSFSVSYTQWTTGCLENLSLNYTSNTSKILLFYLS